VRNAAPVARLAVGPISGSPEITGRWRRPARLSALHRGIFRPGPRFSSRHLRPVRQRAPRGRP